MALPALALPVLIRSAVVDGVATATEVSTVDIAYTVLVETASLSILAMGIGLFAPPFGVGYHFACAIGGVSPERAMSRVWSYLLVLLLAVTLVASLPWISVGARCKAGRRCRRIVRRTTQPQYRLVTASRRSAYPPDFWISRRSSKSRADQFRG